MQKWTQGVDAMIHGVEVSRLDAMDHGVEVLARASDVDLTWQGARRHRSRRRAPYYIPPDDLRNRGRNVRIFISPLGSFSPKTEHEFGFNIVTIKSLICSIDLEEPGILFHILVFDTLIGLILHVCCKLRYIPFLDF